MSTEQQQFLQSRLDHQAERKRFALDMIHKIDNLGWTFQEAHGNEDWQDVTAERRANYAHDVVEADKLSELYKRWYGEATS